MKNTIAISACVLLLGAGLAFVFGTEPARSSNAGRVLILDNEKTLTGEIDKVGEQYRVKRLVGETFIPASRVLKLCTSLEEAHGYMQGRANLDDPDERMRLAEWCRQHGLRERAYQEAKAALALKPTDREIERMVEYLEHARVRAETPSPAVRERPSPRVDVTAESLNLFASKVQPILMNACISCHNAGKPGNFQLTRITGPAMSNRKSLDQNLAVAVGAINPTEPLTSRLLLKAVSIHAPGMTQAPLKSRQAPAYQTLETWVQMTVASNPQLREQALAASPVPIQPRPSESWGDDRGTLAKPPVAVKETKKEKTAPSDEPADPDGFNRQFHPERKQ